MVSAWQEHNHCFVKKDRDGNDAYVCPICNFTRSEIIEMEKAKGGQFPGTTWDLYASNCPKIGYHGIIENDSVLDGIIKTQSKIAGLWADAMMAEREKRVKGF